MGGKVFMQDVQELSSEVVLNKTLVSDEKLDELWDSSKAVGIPIEHHIHEGVYYRTALLKAGVVGIGGVIKIPTTLILSGHCLILAGDEWVEFMGYKVFNGVPYRQQAIKAIEDTYMTMCFKTSATRVEDAEKEFTDEWMLLQTNLKEYKELQQ